MALRVNRLRLAYALAASLAIHALALAVRFPGDLGSRGSPRPMVAYLAPAEAPAVLPAASAPRIAKASSPKRGVSAPVPDAGAAPSAEPVLDEKTSLARYRYELIAAALPYKRYPRQAVEAGSEGDVRLRVAINASGGTDVSVEMSSGQPVLDEQAVEAFRAAAPRVALPPALRGQSFNVEVLAVYSLRD
jgi:TonB family protein